LIGAGTGRDVAIAVGALIGNEVQKSCSRSPSSVVEVSDTYANHAGEGNVLAA
jgi:uncharacterized protein YcfJ